MLSFKTDSKNLIITGASYLVKSILETFEGVWSPTPGSSSPEDFGFWLLPLQHDSADFRYGLELASQRAFKLLRQEEARKQAARTDEYSSPENQKKLSDAMVKNYLKIKSRSGGAEYSQICCASCQLVGLNPDQVICSVHVS